MAERKKTTGGGDAPDKKKDEKSKGKGKVEEIAEPEEIHRTPSQIAREEAEYRAMLRKQRFKRKWPEITKVEIKTRPWRPPPPPRRLPPIVIPRPELTLRRWVPPYRRRRRRRPRLLRVPPEEVTRPLYECSKLRKIWHNFVQVEKNKMILQGSVGCNSKKYSSTACGSQTACIAVVCRALLEETPPARLTPVDVDRAVAAGDRYYRQCALALKCYKGKPQLQLNQLLTSFYLDDTRYTVKMTEVDRGLLAKHPDNIQPQQDLMALMEKRVGTTYMLILSAGDRHFLVWGHPPPPEAASAVRTVCYMFDPHMLNELGQPDKLRGAAAFLRYAGVTSFVLDFLANYGDLESAKRGTPRPAVTLTEVEVVQREPLAREPTYELDLKALRTHCRSEWDSMNINALIEKKIKEGKYPQCSLSAVSLATSRATSRRKVRDFYQKMPKEPAPQLPLPPERPPPALTQDQIMQMRGEGFFLYCPRGDGHAYGRDDMIPRPKSETVLHSPVEVADKNFHSQYVQLDGQRWLLRATRHMASHRYQVFKTHTAVPCCVAALAMLRRLRARAWCEDTLDETLDLGFNLYRESLVERGGPIRRLVLGELKENFRIRDQEYVHKERGIAVWGKMVSADPKVFDLCRGIEQFFKESDSGLLQIPGEIEMAIWNEGGQLYLYHPWPADGWGRRVGLQDGGRACVLRAASSGALCDHLLESLPELRRKPFSIADVAVWERGDLPDPVNKLKPVAPDRWVVRGHFHEADARFPESSRGRQATPAALVAIALAHVLPPAEFTPDDIDDILVRGDTLYQNTMEHLEKLGINLEMPKNEEEAGEEEERGASGTLAAADVLTRFRVTDYDCVETDVLDCAYSGMLTAEPGSGVLSLKDSLRQMFKEYSHAVVTCRGGSVAIWRHEDSYYMFDPHGCDERGFPSDAPRAAACLVRVRGGPDALSAAVLAAAPPGPDDSYNVSPVAVTATRLRPDLGAPETKLESKAFEWIAKGTAAVLVGPRGENSAIGKAAERAGIGEEDMAGRALALPAAAAFVAAAGAVPPPYMHQDHMYNFLDAGADYYLKHVKRTGRRDIAPEDLTEKFELGANTFTLELGEPVRLPLRLPDAPPGEGGEEEEGGDQDETGEELEEEEKEEPMKQIKDALFKQWYDTSQPGWVSLLVGDYHQLGVWQAPGGRVVAFDAAPTLARGQLTPQRIQKGDELRLQRIKDEMAGEGGDEPEEGDEEAGGEGEAQPEPEPQYVPPESCPVLMVFSSPQEFIDKLAMQGRLDPKQCLAPYKLYPVTVRNELTAALRERKPPASKPADEEGAAGDEEEEEALIDPLEDEALGAQFTRLGRAAASLRGRVAQSEGYFLDPNRDNQDAANAVMGIVVEHIEPYVYWKPELIDAILKYGDRLYTASLPRAAAPPALRPAEVAAEFHVTTFNVRLEIEEDAVSGDLKAGDSGAVLNLRRALARFFETYKHGVLCAKGYCVGVWRAADERALVLWEPHCVGPAGRASPGGAATAVLLATVDQLADVFRDNVDDLARPGSNKFSISAVKVFWELSKAPGAVTAQGAVPDEGYEWKVLTGYVETARGRTILRGSRPPDAVRFARDALLQSACGAVVAACMAHVRRPHLWTRRTVDEVLAAGCALFAASLQALGYEFRPGEDVLLPLQVLKRFVLGVNYVRFDLQQAFAGKLEQRAPAEMTVRCALERFFEAHTHGILWSVPHAVAVWRAPGSPAFYMMEPHACGPTGLRVDAHDDGAACVLTFTSAKLMAFAYLQNVPVTERPKHDFQLYAISVNVQPIKKLGGVEPPLVRAPPGVSLVPATSKVDVDGRRRRADEADRKHPPGGATCGDAQRAADARDKDDAKLKGERNTSGWLVLRDGSQFLSAHHSLACARYAAGARGRQALPTALVAAAGARVLDVCRWSAATLDQLLDAGDQLYQDSYLHYRPENKILSIQQVLRKFYTPGNCVCRVVVYRARQKGIVDTDLFEKLSEFFREEKCGVLVAGRGEFAVALFRTPRGYYMFDPLDRDRYGRAVPPPCVGRARACFSQYPNVQSLAEKLGPNIPPVVRTEDDADSKQVKVLAARSGSQVTQVTQARSGEDVKEVHFEEPAPFAIYGLEVTSLRRLNQFEQ